MHAGGVRLNKDMGGLLQQSGRDVLVYHAGRLQLAMFLSNMPKIPDTFVTGCVTEGVAGGNGAIAMQGSQKLATPVRVIRKVHGANHLQPHRRNAQSAHARQYVYVYCGTYEVHVRR